MEQVEGVSQKSFTKALRALQRDALVAQKLFAAASTRVEYSITPLGSELLEHVRPLWIWVAKSVRLCQRLWSADPMNSAPGVDEKRPESWIPAF
jgi:DNA-binding HxlR family transcriptional regulator